MVDTNSDPYMTFPFAEPSQNHERPNGVRSKRRAVDEATSFSYRSTLRSLTAVGTFSTSIGHIVGKGPKRHDWITDIKLDHGVGKERNRSGVGDKSHAVLEYDNTSLIGTHLIRTKWLVPNVEELAECEVLFHLGFHVDNSVSCVRV